MEVGLTSVFNCVFVSFSCGILGQVWYLTVSIPDTCRLSYFNHLPLFNFLTGHSFCGSFLSFVFRVCHCLTVLYVPCSLVVTCWERIDLLALLCEMFSCVFVTFSYGVWGQVWYLIVSIPDICLLPYFDNIASVTTITII